MALTKRLYKNHETVITAQNMNDIQDAILALEQMAGIVPGEGETTKIINVINAAGTVTAAQAAAHPDGLYWVENPITLQNEAQSEQLEVVGLASKRGLTWYVYDNWSTGTTDANGVLLEKDTLASAPAVESISVVKAEDTVTMTLHQEDGSSSICTITLYAGEPENINIDGTDIPISWEGFDG